MDEPSLTFDIPVRAVAGQKKIVKVWGEEGEKSVSLFLTPPAPPPPPFPPSPPPLLFLTLCPWMNCAFAHLYPSTNADCPSLPLPETQRPGENCPVWNHRSSTPSGPLPKMSKAWEREGIRKGCEGRKVK